MACRACHVRHRLALSRHPARDGDQGHNAQEAHGHISRAGAAGRGPEIALRKEQRIG
jgi:hypothetical protein